MKDVPIILIVTYIRLVVQTHHCCILTRSRSLKIDGTLVAGIIEVCITMAEIRFAGTKSYDRLSSCKLRISVQRTHTSHTCHVPREPTFRRSRNKRAKVAKQDGTNSRRSPHSSKCCPARPLWRTSSYPQPRSAVCCTSCKCSRRWPRPQRLQRLPQYRCQLAQTR